MTSDQETPSEAVVEAGDGEVVVVEENGETFLVGGVELELTKQTENEPLETLEASVTDKGSLLFRDERDDSYVEVEVVTGDE